MTLEIAVLGALLSLAAMTEGSPGRPPNPKPHTPSRDTLFNDGWRFLRADGAYGGVSVDDSAWEPATLPHTAHLEPYDVRMPWRGICWYRNHLAPPASAKGKKLFLHFEAAMQLADVWVNGKHKLTHAGGYLPFTVDVTGDVAFGKDNVVAVRLDNRDMPDVPPGKPLADLDFCYHSGLYRNVHLEVTDRLHITDPVFANKTASGGVFVTFPAVSAVEAKVSVKVHVANEHDTAKTASVALELMDGKQVVAKAETTAVELPAGGDHAFQAELEVAKPKLWRPDHPHLYALVVRVGTDEVRTRIGIRRIAWDKTKGFLINGQPLRIRGCNRHQQYPYIGVAASDDAQWRDAKKLKDAGFNFVRLSHYPQANAFLDACDELGLLALDCIPGWQWFRNNDTFRGRAYQDVRDMVRRDRNHPSVVLWEVNLNESGPTTADFMRECHEIAHEEYPGDQTFTGGDSYRHAPWDVPYTEWDQDKFTRPRTAHPEKMGLDREYGDFEFGGNESTTRPLPGDGEDALLLQAWNFQWSHNRNYARPWSYGDAIWCAIDYNRGYNPPHPICAAGVLDGFRLPKFADYFYESQKDPTIYGPMVYVADYWTAKSPRKVVVYSNCDEVELLVNGKSVGKRKPDDGPDTEYGDVPPAADPNYWKAGQGLPKKEEPGSRNVATFDGGNCRHVDHPPFTFPNVAFEPGELKAVGYIGGKAVTSFVRHTPGAPHSLSVRFDTSGRDLRADGGDFVFVYAEVRDASGVLVPDSSPPVTFAVEGPATLVGDNPRNAEAGIATILLRAGSKPGKITITANADSLKPGRGTLSSEGR